MDRELVEFENVVESEVDELEEDVELELEDELEVWRLWWSLSLLCANAFCVAVTLNVIAAMLVRDNLYPRCDLIISASQPHELADFVHTQQIYIRRAGLL